jgi:hypothetical protein
MKIEIPRRNRKCSKCESAFAQGQQYHSVLKESESDDYIREDYCDNCWEESGATHEAIHWTSHVPERKDVIKDLKDQVSRAFHFLKEALEEGDEDEAFFFGVFLARKRKLILRKEHNDIYFYEVPQTEEMIAIKKIDIDHVDKEKLQQAIVNKLNGKIEEDAKDT